MAKIQRNAPCPCGSGKKYKKCCLPLDEAKAVARAEKGSAELPEATPARTGGGPVTVETDLDTLSNSVIDLIAAGDTEKAEAVCQQLLSQFPDQPDGLWRLAEVCKAKGERAKAAEYFRKSAEFMQADPKAFDAELIQGFLDEAEALESAPKPRTEP